MITVVGTGTGTPLPPDVAAGAGLVVGGRRHLDAVRLPEGAERVVLGPLAPALDVIERHLDKESRVLVLASGDPGFFGIVRVLAERFGTDRLEVRAGVSSVAAAFARVGLPWDDAVVVSAHGRDPRAAVNVCRAHPKVAVLTGPGAGPAELGAALRHAFGTPPGATAHTSRARDDSSAAGPAEDPAGSPSSGPRVLVVASALGDPARERVERVTPAEAAGRDWGADVSVVLCLDETRVLGGVRTVAGAPAGPAGWALDEGEFAHRDSMITKFEVRALALARLGPRLGDLVWDVGAGSGSVAVECARLGAAAVAVEKTADGVARIAANARAHGVYVDVRHGSAPGLLDGLPDPDAVFVGGGGAELPAVVTACAVRARRTVVVAMAALDRVPAARAALTGAGFSCDGVLLQSSRLAPLPGEVTRLAATNPVFLLWGTRTPSSEEGVAQ
ncbi:precorrin-6y C5,15-methyltransferase (decarboxylating) subunit CbiE [Streptomyces arenae]|uniref:precorrin-6y C5,15-methyltransferase (decarboxylating) subunit CbiE n=1 Tax=Streptomyces arenae TaxID=29301 RepID=UPI00265958C4|nr:precorrin-6y C5,15-methyltransferase (decarboxylating) subunit CbiE [Streptomyces arenae]MCG7210725.1 precorrin-6y C5,15-methyltransferase (decarboxylating) subunit CbiE [Streptomyces arenae]